MVPGSIPGRRIICKRVGVQIAAPWPAHVLVREGSEGSMAEVVGEGLVDL